MTTRATAIVALALTCAAPAAQATPPDFVQLQDEILAVSAETLFLLRSGTDNLGLYESEIRTVALIALDRNSGALQITDTTGPDRPTVIRLDCGAADGEHLVAASRLLRIPPAP